MPPENVPRRRFLQTAAATSALVGASTAGCTDFVSDGPAAGPGPDRDRPSYAPYVPPSGLFDDAETLGGMYSFLDLETLREYEDLGIEEQMTTPEEPVEGSRTGDVAFAAGPTLGLLVHVFAMFGLVGYSFTGDLMPSFGAAGDDGSDAAFDTKVSVLSSFGYAFVGDYDVDALATAAEQFEAVDERDGFTVFEGQSPDDGDGFSFSMVEDLVFAASPDAVLIPLPDTGEDDSDSGDEAERNREMVERMMDVVAGEEQSAAEADGDVDWMLRTTGHGAFGIGTYGEGDSLPEDGGGVGTDFGGGTDGGAGNESEFFDSETKQALEDIGTLLEDAKLYGSSFEVENESDAVGHAAFAYEDSEDVPSDDEFEAVFGDVAGEFTIESGETRVYLSATQSLEAAED